jgi:hypothetical protein
MCSERNSFQRFFVHPKYLLNGPERGIEFTRLETDDQTPQPCGGCLKQDINLNQIQILILYVTENKHRCHYKDEPLIMLREMTSFWC